MSYTFQEFPKWIYSEIKKEMIIVKDAIEEAFHTAKVDLKAEVQSSTAPVAPASAETPRILSLKSKPSAD